MHHFEDEGKQKIVEEITSHTGMKFSEAMLAYESMTGEGNFYED